MHEYGFPNAALPLGSTAYYLVRFAPAAARDDLALLFAWRRELYRLREISDPGIARVKLQWWQEEFRGLAQKDSAHPLLQALLPMMERHALPSAPFEEMLQAADDDLRGLQPMDLAHMRSRQEQAGGGFAELLQRLHPGQGDENLHTARQLGREIQRAEDLRDIGADLRRGHCRFPPELLEQHGLKASRLREPDAAAPLRTLLAEQGGECRRELESLPFSGPAGRYARLRLRLLEVLLDSGFDVLDQRVSVAPLRKLWHAWRQQ